MGERQILSDPPVVLRPPKIGDVAQRVALGLDPDIHRMLGGNDENPPQPPTEVQVSKWLEALERDPYAWVVEHEGSFLGEVRLRNFDRPSGQAQLFIGLYDPYKLGQGIGRKVIGLVLAHAFGELALRSVTLKVAAFNSRAIRCYQHCGFVEDRREPAAVAVDGRRHEDILMRVLSSAGVGKDVRPTH
jgi:[ribosomal protein S5]-alanine N-acetyltransferase